MEYQTLQPSFVSLLYSQHSSSLPHQTNNHNLNSNPKTQIIFKVNTQIELSMMTIKNMIWRSLFFLPFSPPHSYFETTKIYSICNNITRWDELLGTNKETEEQKQRNRGKAQTKQTSKPRYHNHRYIENYPKHHNNRKHHLWPLPSNIRTT